VREGRVGARRGVSAAPPPRLGGRGGRGGAVLARRGWRGGSERGPIGKKTGAHNPYYGMGLAKPLFLLVFLLRFVAWWRGASLQSWQGGELWRGDMVAGWAAPSFCACCKPLNVKGAAGRAPKGATLPRPCQIGY